MYCLGKSIVCKILSAPLFLFKFVCAQANLGFSILFFYSSSGDDFFCLSRGQQLLKHDPVISVKTEILGKSYCDSGHFQRDPLQKMSYKIGTYWPISTRIILKLIEHVKYQDNIIALIFREQQPFKQHTFFCFTQW